MVDIDAEAVVFTIGACITRDTERGDEIAHSTGILFFDELEHYRTQQAVLLIVGLLVTLMGVAALNCKFGQPEGALSPRHAARVAPTDQAAATLMRSLDLDDDETPGDTPAPG